MSELRKDPVMGRWIIIANERARRPGSMIDWRDGDAAEEPCPFCEKHEAQTPPEIYAVRTHHSKPNHPEWKVRVVPSINPILGIDGNLTRRGHSLYDVLDGFGAHEVIIETPKHIAHMGDLPEEQIQVALETYIVRMKDLENDRRFKYVLAYKNYGWMAGGGRIRHSRSQIIATPVNPMRVKEELAGAKKYFEYHERCVYCDLIRQEKDAQTRVILETDHFIALAPFASRFPFEIWILPKKHSCDFVRTPPDVCADLAKILKNILLRLKIGLDDPPFNYVIHTAPFRRWSEKKNYWETIEEDYHWHIEVMPRLTRVAGFEKGTGFYICPIPPEMTAEYLREVEILK